MKRIELFSILILLTLYSCNFKKNNSQLESQLIENENSVVDSLKFDCYSGSQLEMNICSYQEFKHSDSILNCRYDTLLQRINQRLLIEMDYEDAFEYKKTQNIKGLITKSQENWVKIRAENSDIYRLIYLKGTMESMVANLQMIKDTKNRIVFIENLIKEFEE